MISTDLATRITAHPQWYHTLDLGPGLQTPGWFDLRGVVDAAGMPASLAGKRCLDVATFDGFWAFEMEKRGAASVVGIDLIDPHLWDWPVSRPADAVEGIAARKGLGDGFLLAKEALDSKVERRAMSVYDLNPSEVGMFDFVYVGSLLLHLRDPVRALEAVRSVCADTALLVDAIDLPLTMTTRRPIAVFDGKDRPWWWKPNLPALRRMIESAGFEVIGKPRRVMMPAGAGQEKLPIGLGLLKALRYPEGRVVTLHARVGDPHAAFTVRPVDHGR